MPTIARVVLALCLLPVIAFCAFGFLASYEPPGFVPIRIAYAVIGLAAFVGAGFLAFRRPTPSSS
ncbi:hypothetical protein [Limnoglobus roseus]|uniref:Uncharacterized protein n=1 Tax=Limnoglobus roseus TaxID=2598579 RepID=A0A5C1AJ07_9BACT|nr:hypothetical protein [Limnoglobus roseus]QEL17682.1 hypothetical protein PX52LOC_04680 [Limnoglobus roseus]